MSTEALLRDIGAVSTIITARSALAIVKSCPNHQTAILTLQAWVDQLEVQKTKLESEGSADAQHQDI